MTKLHNKWTREHALLTRSQDSRNLRGVEISSSMPWDVDQTVEQVLVERKTEEQALRFRISIAIFSPKLQRYVQWRQVAWGVSIRSLDEAQQLRTGLQLFFRAAATFGMPGVVTKLQEILRGEAERELPTFEDEGGDGD